MEMNLSVIDLRKVTSFISEILDKEEALNRYDGVPDDEKSALKAIENVTEKTDNSNAIKQQLDNLSFSIKKNQTNLRRAQWVNGLALFISLVGICFSVYNQFYK